jgi:copper resistance protein B
VTGPGLSLAAALAGALLATAAQAHPTHSTAPAAPADRDAPSAAPYGPPIADQAVFSHLVVGQLEGRFGDGGADLHWSAEAWRGDSASRLWLRTEGVARQGRVEEARVEVLHARPVTTFWDIQAGVRADTGRGPGRTWAALGVEGMAPWYSQVSATAYAGEHGLAAHLAAADELRLTQRLIAEPRVEADLYSRDDPARGLGSGFSSLVTGLRLRYEITRKFAPYLGLTWARRFGRTADLARAGGERAEDMRAVVGVRVWF